MMIDYDAMAFESQIHVQHAGPPGQTRWCICMVPLQLRRLA
jgi:hypothetical protein